jgi:hypothetical protein
MNFKVKINMNFKVKINMDFNYWPQYGFTIYKPSDINKVLSWIRFQFY